MHKKASKKVDAKVRNAAMSSKLKDACAYAKRLRQDKNVLKNRILKKYQHRKSEGKRIINNLLDRYRDLRRVEMDHAVQKSAFLRNKNKAAESLREAPAHTKDLLSGVNIFSPEVGSLSVTLTSTFLSLRW